MFNPKLKNFGVLKVEKNIVKLFESKAQYSTLSVGQPIEDVRWAGDSIVIRLMDGKVRRYTTLSQYVTI
jgi:hypothetical protein